MRKISFRDYYTSARTQHSTGDIWKNLPSMGLLKRKQCSGIIITPACDLEQAKTETVTYLPIVSIKEFLVSRAYYPHVYKKLISLSRTYQDDTIQTLLSKNFLPALPDLEVVINEYKAKTTDKNGVIHKIVSGLSWTKDICNTETYEVNEMLIKQVFVEKDILELKSNLVRNSFSTDLHFLPRDEEDIEWSAVINHAVALFRYPVTVPIEILDMAHRNHANWEERMQAIGAQFAVAKEFKIPPLKVSRLTDTFLSDMLTRFAGLYIRIGSPDFDDNTIIKYTNEI